MNQTPDGPGRWGAGAWLAHGLAAVVAFAFAFTPLRTSTDEFWHLKTGQWIAEHGLPAKDIFTYTAADFPWNNHEWLSELAMWKLYHFADLAGWGGWRAVIFVKALFIVLAFSGFGLLLARRLSEPAWGALAAALAAALARRTFYPRPPFITYLFLAILLWLLLEWRAGHLRTRWLAMLAPMFALWANLHGGWMAGLVVVGAFWAEILLATALGKGRDAQAIANLKTLTLAGFGCVLGSLVNPYGWKLYTLPFHVSKDPYLMASIGEMMPPEWTHVWVLGGVIALILAAAARPATWRAAALTALVVWLLSGALRGFSDEATTLARQVTPSQMILSFPAVLIAQLRDKHPFMEGWSAKTLPVLQFAFVLPVFLFAAWRSKLPGWPAHFLLIAFFGYEAIFHVRHLPLLAIVVLPVLAANLDAWHTALFANRKRPIQLASRWLPIAALLPLAVFWIFNHREGYSFLERDMMLAGGTELQPIPEQFPPSLPAYRKPLPSTIPQRGIFLAEPYPVTAVNFMLAANLPGPIFNGGNYCGYLIWRLAPEHYKMFTDNRYDIFGGLVIRDEHSVLEGWDQESLDSMKNRDPIKSAERHTWQEVLDQWKIQTLFLPRDADVNYRLSDDKNWTRVYEDIDWTLWVRNTPENRPAIDRALDMPRPKPWLTVLQLAPDSPTSFPATMRESLAESKNQSARAP